MLQNIQNRAARISLASLGIFCLTSQLIPSPKLMAPGIGTQIKTSKDTNAKFLSKRGPNRTKAACRGARLPLVSRLFPLLNGEVPRLDTLPDNVAHLKLPWSFTLVIWIARCSDDNQRLFVLFNHTFQLHGMLSRAGLLNLSLVLFPRRRNSFRTGSPGIFFCHLAPELSVLFFWGRNQACSAKPLPQCLTTAVLSLFLNTVCFMGDSLSGAWRVRAA